MCAIAGTISGKVLRFHLWKSLRTVPAVWLKMARADVESLEKSANVILVKALVVCDQRVGDTWPHLWTEKGLPLCTMACEGAASFSACRK